MKNPPPTIQKIICRIDNLIYKWVDKDRFLPNILSAQKTVELAVKEKMSLARYGDGEFSMVLRNDNTSFQQYESALASRLLDTFLHPDPNVLICIPKVFNWKDRILFNRTGRRFWSRYLKRQGDDFFDLMKTHSFYGDSRLSRPYIDTLKIPCNRRAADQFFSVVRSLWLNKRVLIVEGELTRFGVGNDLLNCARSVQRILCPAKDCFRKYDHILDSILEVRDVDIVLIALGPTATVLTNDLARHQYGIQAIDIGHLDIEYEWFRRKAFRKTVIKGKFVNEVSGGDIVNWDSDRFDASEYQSQVIKRISL